MKWLAAGIRICRGREFSRSIHAVNQAGTDGFTNETIQTGRPAIRVVPSRCAFSATLPQVGCGPSEGVVCCGGAHEPPGFDRSQRRSPIATAEAPPLIWKEKRSGACIFHVV